MAAFGIAMLMHIATNLLHVREDVLRRASRVARVTGTSVIAETDAGTARMNLAAMCEKLLANTVIEKYEIELK